MGTSTWERQPLAGVLVLRFCSAIAVLAVSGSLQPYVIIGTSILATTCSTIARITAVKLLEKLPGFRLPPVQETSGRADSPLPASWTA